MSNRNALILLAGVLVIIATLSVGNKYFNKPAPPQTGYYPDPKLANSADGQCKAIVQSAGGIAAASGNPYAMAACAAAILAPGKVCEGGNAVWDGISWVGTKLGDIF